MARRTQLKQEVSNTEQIEIKNDAQFVFEETVKKPIVIRDEIKQRLTNIVPEYFRVNSLVNKEKKIADVLKVEIKDIMQKNKLQKYIFDQIAASISISSSGSYDEDVLLELLRPLNCKGLIKTKEYIDMNILETLIYKNEVDAKILKPAEVITETVRLNVKALKG